MKNLLIFLFLVVPFAISNAAEIHVKSCDIKSKNKKVKVKYKDIYKKKKLGNKEKLKFYNVQVYKNGSGWVSDKDELEYDDDDKYYRKDKKGKYSICRLEMVYSYKGRFTKRKYSKSVKCYYRDTEAPVLKLKETSIALGSSGKAILSFAKIDDGSTDNQGIDRVDINPCVFDCDDVGEQRVKVTAYDKAGNSSKKYIDVTIEDNDGPNLSLNGSKCGWGYYYGQNRNSVNLYLNKNGEATLSNSYLNVNDNCGVDSYELDQTKFTCDDLGTNTVDWDATDVNGNLSTGSISVKVHDITYPTIATRSTKYYNQNVTVTLTDEGYGELLIDDVDNGAYDNCSIEKSGFANISTLYKKRKCVSKWLWWWSGRKFGQYYKTKFSDEIQKLTFDCDDAGKTFSFFYWVEDASKRQVAVKFNVKVVDESGGIPTEDEVTLSLENGKASLYSEDLGFSGSCSAPSNELIGEFDCDDLGTSTRIFRYLNSDGDSVDFEYDLTIVDDEAPKALANDVTLKLDENGEATLSIDDVDNGSNDNCNIETLSLSKDSFNCDDLGESIQTLTVSDKGLNTSSVDFNVTVLDEINPVSDAKEEITIYLNTEGEANIVASDIDENSFDNCGIETLSISKTNFTGSDLGNNSVTLTVTDASGNSDWSVTNVIIADNIPPTISTRSIEIELDENGEASISIEDLDDGTSDNVEINELNINVETFNCDNLGFNEVIFTATDLSGNTAEAEVIVNVRDRIKPVLLVDNVDLQVDEDGLAYLSFDDIDEGSYDNCSFDIEFSQSVFDCSELEPIDVDITMTDSDGNSVTETISVEVADNVDPVLITKNIIVYLDENGDVELEPEDFDDGSYDNCEIDEIELEEDEFECSDIGVQEVEITLEDRSGNEVTGFALVTIIDDLEPEVQSKEITVYVDENGEVSIEGEDLDDESFDNCEDLEYFSSKYDFTTDDLGDNEVLFTVVDPSGNSSSESTIVTVVDEIEPTVIANDISIELDENGEASISVEDVNNGSFDNHEVIFVWLEQESFDCSHIGPNTVKLFAEDPSGNIGSSEFTLTIKDPFAPEIDVDDITLEISDDGFAYLNFDDIDQGSYDNCSFVVSYSQSKFDCSELEPIEVLVTLTDPDGNSSSQEINVEVSDRIDPVLITKDITVYLDENGDVELEPEDFDNGSYDNCGIDEMELENDEFECGDIGTHEVEITIEDNSGNEVTGFAYVTILDNMAPSFEVSDIEVTLNSDNEAEISEDDFDIEVSDNCEEYTLEISKTEFTSNDIGANTVKITATDNSDNSFSADVTVTIIDNSQAKLSFTKNQIDIEELTVYPNPFTDQTNISYVLSEDQVVEVSIYSLSGNKLQTLDYGYKRSGTYQLTWFGIDQSGNAFANGVYYLMVQTEEGTEAHLITLEK